MLATRKTSQRRNSTRSAAPDRGTSESLPVAALVDQFYAQVQARGGGRWDTSSLMHLLAKD